MQQQAVPIVPQKRVDARIAAGVTRSQPLVKLRMAHPIDFKAIKRASNFERVLQHYGIDLRSGRGAQRKALCPFHRDTRPSLNVNLDMKVFNCFSCGDGGDIVKFVAKKEYPADPEGHVIEAVEKLAEICGIRINDNRAEPLAKAAQRSEVTTEEKPPGGSGSTASAASVEPTNGESTVPNPPLTFQLRVDPTHLYLSERGLEPTMIEAFGLGYCLSEKSIMRQRILIPIHNEHGELVAYAGRWPGNSGWSEGAYKYMLPPKFQKMRVLFNLHRVIEGMFEGLWPDHERHIVVVEGYFGVFAIHELAPCVALMGSYVSPHHVRVLLEHNARYVTLLLDGPTKPETEEQSFARERKTAAAVYQLASSGLFVNAPKLGIGEQPDTIDRMRLVELVSL